MSVFFALIAAVSAASATDEPLFTLPMDFPDGTRAALRVHRDSQPHLLVVEFCQRYGCRGDDLNLLVGEVHARYVKHTGACPTGLRVPLPADRAAGTALRPSAHCVCDTARAFQLRQDGLGCDALSCVGPVCSADWHFQHEGAAARRAAGHDTLNFTSPNAGAAGARHAQDDGVELVDASQLPQQQADWQRRGIILVVLGVVFVFFAALARVEEGPGQGGFPSAVPKQLRPWWRGEERQGWQSCRGHDFQPCRQAVGAEEHAWQEAIQESVSVSNE